MPSPLPLPDSPHLTFSAAPPAAGAGARAPRPVRMHASTSLPPIRELRATRRRFPDKPRASFEGRGGFARATSMQTLTPTSSFTEYTDSPPPSPRSVVHAVPAGVARAQHSELRDCDLPPVRPPGGGLRGAPAPVNRPPSPRPRGPVAAAIQRGKQWMIWTAASRRGSTTVGQRFRRTSFAAKKDDPKKKRRHSTEFFTSVTTRSKK